MKVLGIHDGHNSTACLVEDGRIVAMASEERFVREKNHCGFPAKAVEWILRSTKTSPQDLNAIALPGLAEPMRSFGNLDGPFHAAFTWGTRMLPVSLMGTEALVKPYLWLNQWTGKRMRLLRQYFPHFDLPLEKARLVEHHTAHAAAAYFLSWHRKDSPKTLVLTLDGTGDGFSNTVSIAEGNKLKRVSAVQSLHSLGMLYTGVTRYLGLKPFEDEYKVMGMAPYARGPRAQKAYEKFKEYLRLSSDGLRMESPVGLWEGALLQRLKNDFFRTRFDDLASGIQRFFEEIARQYVLNWVRHTGIRHVAVGGGVFMNVKLNMLLRESPEIEKIFFLPSAGDESIAAGAALQTYVELCESQGRPAEVAPLHTLYFGPDSDACEIESTLESYAGRVRWEHCKDLERKTAELLAQGRILGRMSGRMEWGARALGNRSIVARADSMNNIRKLNAAIKMRDFWMPFAPSILWERRHDYIEGAGDTIAPYMILAFNSTPRAAHDIIAALHPADLTCRPQLVQESWNRKYHRLLRYYEELTGYGGLLNTSFNLHGEPIVCTSRDAIETLLSSQLDYITIEDYLVWAVGREAPREHKLAEASTVLARQPT